MAEYSYIGKGKVYLAPHGSGPARFIGNCTKLNLSASEDKKELLDYTSGGGGKINSLTRISAVSTSMAVSDLSAENLATATFGEVDAVAAGTVTDESQTAYKGGLVVTDYMIDTTVAPVVTNSAGTTTYVADTDYQVSAAGIFILDAGAIVDASTIKIDYTKKAGNVVEALTQSPASYTLIFDGLNEAQSGKRVVVTMHKVKFGPLKDYGLIADDFASLELDGEVLSDDLITGTGLSRYFKVAMAS